MPATCAKHGTPLRRDGSCRVCRSDAARQQRGLPMVPGKRASRSLVVQLVFFSLLLLALLATFLVVSLGSEETPVAERSAPAPEVPAAAAATPAKPQPPGDRIGSESLTADQREAVEVFERMRGAARQGETARYLAYLSRDAQAFLKRDEKWLKNSMRLAARMDRVSARADGPRVVITQPDEDRSAGGGLISTTLKREGAVWRASQSRYVYEKTSAEKPDPAGEEGGMEGADEKEPEAVARVTVDNSGYSFKLLDRKLEKHADAGEWTLVFHSPTGGRQQHAFTVKYHAHLGTTKADRDNHRLEYLARGKFYLPKSTCVIHNRIVEMGDRLRVGAEITPCAMKSEGAEREVTFSAKFLFSYPDGEGRGASRAARAAEGSGTGDKGEAVEDLFQ